MLNAVVVVEVPEAAHTRLAVVVIELMIAGRGALEEFEGAPVLVKRVLEVRVVAVLVLLVAEHGHEVGLHPLHLLGGRVLRLVAHRGARTLIAGVRGFSDSWGAPGWQEMSPTVASTGDGGVAA